MNTLVRIFGKLLEFTQAICKCQFLQPLIDDIHATVKVSSQQHLRDSLLHECDLPQDEDIVVTYIDSGWFVYLRRAIRKLTIVSENNPMSLAVLRSSAAIKYEKRRHLHYFYYTIHPFSIARAYWEFIFMGILIIALIIIPFETASRAHQFELETLKFILDMFFITDVALTFFTGFFDKNTKRIVLRKKKIAMHYVGELFIFDLLSSLNPHMLMSLFMTQRNEDQETYYLKLFNFFKIMRLPTLLHYIDRFKNWRQSSTYKFKIFKMVYIGIVCTLWGGVLLYYLAMYTQEPFLIGEKNHEGLPGFLICYSRIVRLVLLVGVGRVAGASALIYIFEIVTLIGGAVFHTYTMSQILQFVNKYNSSANKYYQLTQGLHEYASYNRLPDHLRHRVIQYFDFKFQMKYFKESEIMTTISEQLKNSIVLHSCKNLLEKVAIFNDLPPSLLVTIVTAMRSTIYLPGDVIVQAGSEGDSMFFILTGTVAIYTSFGKEVCHLADGSHFGEIALVMPGEKRVASVIAVDPCELFSLTRKDFTKAIQPYPDLYFRIRKLAQSRLTKTMEEMEKEEVKQVKEAKQKAGLQSFDSVGGDDSMKTVSGEDDSSKESDSSKDKKKKPKEKEYNHFFYKDGTGLTI